MRHPFRIIQPAACLLCLLLLVSLAIFWIACAASPKAIWWNHGGPYADFHFVTIHDGRIVLAHYRVTSDSPAMQRVKLFEDLLKLQHEAIRLDEKRLDILVARQPPDSVQVSQARATLEQRNVDLVRMRYDVASQHDDLELPPEPGPGWSVAEKRTVSHTDLIAPNTYLPYSTQNLLNRLEPDPADKQSRFAGLSLSRADFYYGHRWIAEAPLWLVLSFLMIVPTITAIQFLKSRRRQKLNLCPTCGYDLRASPDRCPECGTISGGAPS